MRSVAASENVIPFRRPPGLPPRGALCVNGGVAAGSGRGQSRAEQRSLMDAVYATGAMIVAAADRQTKLLASRLQVYGFLTVEEIGEDGSLRRLRPSEAIRAREDRPWRLSKSSFGSGLPVTIPTIDDFLFEPADMPA